MSTTEASPFLAPGEVAPDHKGPAVEHLECDWCDWKRPKIGRWTPGWLSNHVKAKHPEHYVGKVQPAKAWAPKKAPAEKKPAQAKAPAPRTPARPARRSLASGIGDLVSSLGQVAQFVEPPVGNVLVFESDAAGVAIDQAFAGTFIDRKLLQPAAGAGDRLAPVASTLGLPLLVLLVSRNPKLRVPLDPYLRRFATDVLRLSLPAMKKRRDEELEAIDAVRELGAFDERYNGFDPVGVLLDDLLGIPGRVEPDPDEATGPGEP